MKLSIIVIYQEKNLETERCIDSVRRSKGNLNGWRALKSRNPRKDIEVLTSNKPNKSLARNELVNQSKGDIIVFIDSDAEASDFWLHELLKPFEDPQVAVVGGCNILRQNASPREVLADKLLTFPLATWKSSSRYRVCGKKRVVDESELTSCNLAIRKQVFLEAGGFPLDFIPCEENILLNKIEELGYKMIYNPLAIVFHSRDELLIPYLKKIFYYAVGRGKMIRYKKGGLKFIPAPSNETILLGLGLIFHYFAYVGGLIWGIIDR